MLKTELWPLLPVNNKSPPHPPILLKAVTDLVRLVQHPTLLLVWQSSNQCKCYYSFPDPLKSMENKYWQTITLHDKAKVKLRFCQKCSVCRGSHLILIGIAPTLPPPAMPIHIIIKYNIGVQMIDESLSIHVGSLGAFESMGDYIPQSCRQPPQLPLPIWQCGAVVRNHQPLGVHRHI